MTDQDEITKDFFLDIWENDDYFETDNEAEAMQHFYACPFSCVLWKKGKILGEKDWVEDEIEDSVGLSAEVVGQNYVNLNS